VITVLTVTSIIVPAYGQSNSTIAQLLQWIKPSQAPHARLVGKPVAFCLMSDNRNSQQVLRALREFRQTPASQGIEIVAVWVAVGPRMLDSLTLQASFLDLIAVDLHRDVYQYSTRSKMLPYLLLADTTHNIVWEGTADSTIDSDLRTFSLLGHVPPDPSRPLSTEAVSGLSLRIQPASFIPPRPLNGTTSDHGRRWVRGATAPNAVGAIVSYMYPEADVHAVDAHSNTLRYDVDLTSTSEEICYQKRDSIVHLLDSALGTITDISSHRMVQQTLVVVDSLELSRARSDSGITIREFADRYRDRFYQSIVWHPSTLFDGRYDLPRSFDRQDSVSARLRSVGLRLMMYPGTSSSIVVRSTHTPESEVIYLLNRTHVIPSFSATAYAVSDKVWYGGEAGVNVGILASGHGFYGFYAWRGCIEVLSDGSSVIGGINAGVDLSSIFVMRLRGGIYSDFRSSTSLMVIPEFGFSFWGHYAFTVGGMIPLLGAQVLPPSIRCSLTWNLLPKGAH